MAKDALTPTEQTLFAELVQQVETAVPAGTVYTRERGGTQYYYAKIPVGVDRIDTFIGKIGDAEAEAKVAELNAVWSRPVSDDAWFRYCDAPV